MPPRNAPSVPTTTLPEFLLSKTLGEFVASGLDLLAVDTRGRGGDDQANAGYEAIAALYEHAARQIRNFSPHNASA